MDDRKAPKISLLLRGRSDADSTIDREHSTTIRATVCLASVVEDEG